MLMVGKLSLNFEVEGTGLCLFPISVSAFLTSFERSAFGFVNFRRKVVF